MPKGALLKSYSPDALDLSFQASYLALFLAIRILQDEAFERQEVEENNSR